MLRTSGASADERFFRRHFRVPRAVRAASRRDSLQPSDPTLRAKVQAFARGELPAGEHERSVCQLQADPALVGYLTETVKSLRGKEEREEEG